VFGISDRRLLSAKITKQQKPAQARPAANKHSKHRGAYRPSSGYSCSYSWCSQAGQRQAEANRRAALCAGMAAVGPKGAATVPVGRMYRHFMQALRTYPSKKREDYIEVCKTEFRTHSHETDPDKIELHKQMAMMELERLQAYSGIAKKGDMSLDIL
jgi:hypothetical protein